MNLYSQGEGMWHPQLGRVGYKVQQMSYDPDDQVRQTLNVMRGKVAEDAANPQFLSRVRNLIPVSDQVEEAKKIWAHTRNGIRFQRDEITGAGINGIPEEEVVETIIRPVDMANFMDQGNAVGDCDDFSMYAAACLKALGIPCTFVTTAADARDPGQFSHVYVVAYPMDPRTGGRVRMPIDASHGEYAGWETQGYGRYQEWPVWDKVAWFIGKAVTQGIVYVGVYLLMKQLTGRMG